MSANAGTLAREIVDALNEHEHASYEEAIEIIAAKIKPIVEGAERWKRECNSIRSVALKNSLRADDADRYERWLLDIGRAIGCQHLDEQLPNCVIQHLQGDQESEATNAPNPAN